MRTEELVSRCAENGILLNETMTAQLNAYALLLAEWNEKMNLTAITEPEAIIEKHFYDCLIPLAVNRIQGRTADVGSGAGFPGIVWKIARPDLEMELIEPTGKRCTFLNAAIHELGLQNIKVINARSEDYVKTQRESFDTVTARAVASLRILSELCAPLVKVGGCFVPLKGQAGMQETKEAENAVRILGLSLQEAQKAVLPSGDERVNLFFLKTQSTPRQYPRNYGRIRKQPL